MYLNQTPTGFNLGEKLDYKPVLRESGRGRGGPSPLNSRMRDTFPGLALAYRPIDGSDYGLAAGSIEAGGGCRASNGTHLDL